MDSEVSADEGEIVVRCDHCSAFVRAKASGPMKRSFSDVVVDERWCKQCIRDVEENTAYAIGRDGASTPNELGLDT